MAGDWIKYDKTLPDKLEVIAIADALDCTRAEVVGHLLGIWAWADSVTENGDAPSVTEKFIDATARAGFAEAMRKNGWLKVHADGHISIPKFDRHISKSSKQRALAKDRMQRHRDDARVMKPSLEKRREEKKKKPPLPPKNETTTKGPPPPKTQPDSWEAACAAMTGAVLKTDKFQAAWRAWSEHRREIKHPLKATMVKAQIKKLEGWGEEQAVAVIEHTIFKGWQGLRGPEGDDQKSAGRSPAPPGKYDDVKFNGVVENE